MRALRATGVGMGHLRQGVLARFGGIGAHFARQRIMAQVPFVNTA